MDEHFYIALVALIVPAIVGRVILSNATKKLNHDKKEQLSKSLTGTTKIRYIVIFVVAISSVTFPKSLIILLPLLLIGGTLFYWLKISKMAMPKHYTISFFMSAGLGLIGVIWFILINNNMIY